MMMAGKWDSNMKRLVTEFVDDHVDAGKAGIEWAGTPGLATREVLHVSGSDS